MSVERGSDIFAFTPTYGGRTSLPQNVFRLRALAGCWYDWGVWAGAPSPQLAASLEELLDREDQSGIQLLRTWPENRGQHHATSEALAHARARGYKWLLRIDDDITPKTKRWLSTMIQRLAALRAAAGDTRDRLVAAPRLLGLKNPLKPQAQIQLPTITFPTDVMHLLGGAVRLQPLELLDGYEPCLLDPKGRRDPQGIAEHVAKREGVLVRFPDIRVIHDTAALEATDTPQIALVRRMGKTWPHLGAGAP